MIEACAHCGARVPVDAPKCPNCGSVDRVGARRAAAPSTPAADLPTPSAPRRASGAVVASIAAGVVALGAAAGAAALFFVVTPATPSGSGPAPEAGAAPAPVASGFAGVRARGKLRIAADPDAPPFLAGNDQGWEGFEYALMSAIAGQAKVEFTLVPAPFDALLDQVRSGAADLAIGQLTPTPSEGIAWSLSYLQYDVCLAVAAGSRVRRLEDLAGATIGLYDDAPTRAAVDRVLPGRWTPRLYNTFGYFDALAAGELGGVVYDCPLARHELRGRTDVRIVDEVVAVGTYAVALAADASALRGEVDEVLVELGSTGLLQGLASRWLATPDRPQDYRSASGGVVVVRPGETLDAVATRALGAPGRAAELKALNQDILGSGGTAVYAGMRLRVGGGTTSAR